MADFVEGWTGVIEYQLLADDVAVNLTGFTVGIQTFGADQGPLSLGGTVVVTSSTGGKVEYRPATTCELKSVYSPIQVRFKVTDGASKITYYPNAAPELWTVRRF